MPTILASDLDQTLIYSRRFAANDGHPDQLVAVEHKETVPLSYMLVRAATQLAKLSKEHIFVPVTTRTTMQFRRIDIPQLRHDFAVTANGGEILIDSQPCPDWTARVRATLANSLDVAEVQRRLSAQIQMPWVRSVRVAQELFIYFVLNLDATPDSFVADVQDRMEGAGWRVVLQGRKLYVLPIGLTKEAALAEVVVRTGATHVLAAGDSSLDLGMLEIADRSISPAHGYLDRAELARLNGCITQSSGVYAGAEIVQWFATSSPRKH